jgi:3-dehydroquinate synthase
MTYINLPTSLIGQVDAAIGGKSALNVNGIKNQAGLFYDPAAVFIMPVFLETLPEAHYKSGLAEIIKCAVLSGSESWELLKLEGAMDRNHIFGRIIDTVSFKCRVVAEDPFDRSGRKMLNFGHTIGHALESVCNIPGKYEMLHGQAVAIGMICEAYLSNKLAGMSANQRDELVSVMKSNFDLNPVEKSLFNEISRYVNYDKKKTVNGIGFVLLESFGKHSPDKFVDYESFTQSLIYYNSILKQ